MNAWQEREDIAIIDFELNQTSNNQKNKAAGENQFQFNFSGLNFFRLAICAVLTVMVPFSSRKFVNEIFLLKNIKKVRKF